MEKGVRNFLVHLCGNHTGNLVHWRDIPFPPRTIFSIGHEMDLEATGRFIGSGNVLAGNVSTSILQGGTPDEVFTETVRCLRTGMKHPGGFVLMPACEFRRPRRRRTLNRWPGQCTSTDITEQSTKEEP